MGADVSRPEAACFAPPRPPSYAARADNWGEQQHMRAAAAAHLNLPALPDGTVLSKQSMDKMRYSARLATFMYHDWPHGFQSSQKRDAASSSGSGAVSSLSVTAAASDRDDNSKESGPLKCCVCDGPILGGQNASRFGPGLKLAKHYSCELNCAKCSKVIEENTLVALGEDEEEPCDGVLHLECAPTAFACAEAIRAKARKETQEALAKKRSDSKAAKAQEEGKELAEIDDAKEKPEKEDNVGDGEGGLNLNSNVTVTGSLGWVHLSSALSAEYLSAAGFHFTPSPEKPDLVVCFCCQASAFSWRPTDIPLDVHLHKNPKCPYAMQLKPAPLPNGPPIRHGAGNNAANTIGGHEITWIDVSYAGEPARKASAVPRVSGDSFAVPFDSLDATLSVPLLTLKWKGPSAESAYFSLFVCGNSRTDLGQALPLLEEMRDVLHCDVYAFDYRGFGATAPAFPIDTNELQATWAETPTEWACYRTARSVYDFVTSALGVPPQRLMFFGNAVGASVCTELACALYSGTKPAEELDGPKPEKKRKSRLGSRKSKNNTEESTEEKFDFPGIAGMILVSPITSVLRLGAARTLAFRLLISGEELDNMAISMTADDEPAIPERGKKTRRGFATLSRKVAASAKNSVKLADFSIAAGSHDDFFDAKKRAAKVPCPVFLATSTDDPIVSFKMAHKLAHDFNAAQLHALGHPGSEDELFDQIVPARVFEVEGCGHMLDTSPEHFGDVLDELVDWVKDRLPSSEAEKDRKRQAAVPSAFVRPEDLVGSLLQRLGVPELTKQFIAEGYFDFNVIATMDDTDFDILGVPAISEDTAGIRQILRRGVSAVKEHLAGFTSAVDKLAFIAEFFTPVDSETSDTGGEDKNAPSLPTPGVPEIRRGRRRSWSERPAFLEGDDSGGSATSANSSQEKVAKSRAAWSGQRQPSHDDLDLPKQPRMKTASLKGDGDAGIDRTKNQAWRRRSLRALKSVIGNKNEERQADETSSDEDVALPASPPSVSLLQDTIEVLTHTVQTQDARISGLEKDLEYAKTQLRILAKALADAKTTS